MVQAVEVQAEPTCDRDCPSDAVFIYQWDWGEKGVCCARHATLLQQTASQLSRGVTLHPLQRATPAPLQRDERARLIGDNIVLQQETEEAKARGLELYRLNGDLVRQVQTLKAKATELEQKLKDADQQVLDLEGQLVERDAEHAELVQEIERLRTLEALVAPAFKPAPEPAPQETTTTVDG